MRPTTRVLTVLIAVATLAGCREEGPGDQRTDSVTPEAMEAARANWPAGVAPQIDSANAAYSKQDYETALRHYRAAVQIGPDVPAAWWGIYMAEHARGNIAAADSAMQRARKLVPEASLVHPTRADTRADTGGTRP